MTSLVTDTAILAAYERNGRSYAKTARELGIDYRTVRRRIPQDRRKSPIHPAAKAGKPFDGPMTHTAHRATEAPSTRDIEAPISWAQNSPLASSSPAIGVSAPRPSDGYSFAPGVELPELPAADEPIEDVIARKVSSFQRVDERAEAERWMQIRLREQGPCGIMWWGDPHLDDESCNWPLLLLHLKLTTQPHIYGVNIGDTGNNWVGRLVKKYADQQSTADEARHLAKWFFADSGVNWLLWLVGNHDAWNDGSYILRQLIGDRAILNDWDARFRLVWPDGGEVRIHAAHGFKGHSMYHPTHGGLKTALMKTDADLHVSGHIHEWGEMSIEQPGRDHVNKIVSARGYKWHDEYARRHGFEQGRTGASVLTILNPHAEDPAGRVLPFADIEAGVVCLEAIRARYGLAERSRAAVPA